MLRQKDTPKNVDEYIKMFPANVQSKLKTIRDTIRKAAPGAEEVISYSMPAYKQNGILVYFAAHTSHIGFYPGGRGIEEFKDKLKDFKMSKGTIQLPYDKKMPLKVIASIVKLRVKQNLAKAKRK